MREDYIMQSHTWVPPLGSSSLVLLNISWVEREQIAWFQTSESLPKNRAVRKILAIQSAQEAYLTYSSVNETAAHPQSS